MPGEHVGRLAVREQTTSERRTITRSTSGSASATRCSTRTVVAPVRRWTTPIASRTNPAPAGIDVRGRLVEQQQTWRQRQHAGEGKPLLFASGELVGALVTPVGKPTAASAASTTGQISAAGVARFSSPNATSSPARAMTSCVSGSCRTSPVRSRKSRGSRPSTVNRPSASPAWDGSRRPASAASSVLFPAPDAPSSNTRSPGSTTRSSPCKAWRRRPACRHPHPRASIRQPVRPAPGPARTAVRRVPRWRPSDGPAAMSRGRRSRPSWRSGRRHTP